MCVDLQIKGKDFFAFRFKVDKHGYELFINFATSILLCDNEKIMTCNKQRMNYYTEINIDFYVFVS